MPETEFVIRRAIIEDVPVIVRHRRAMFEELGYGVPVLLEKMVETFEAWVSDEIKNGGYLGWLVTAEDGTAVGSVGLRIRGWSPRAKELAGKQGYVVGVFVEQAFRGRGIGRLLMHTLMDWSREHALACLILHPSEQACDMYLAMGFEPDGEAYKWVPETFSEQETYPENMS